MSQIINLTPGAAHIVTKPRLFNHNGPNPSDGPGDGAVETGGAEEATGKGGEGGEGKDRAEHYTHPLSAEPPAGTERAIWPEKERRRRSRGPRGRRREE